MTTHLAPGDVLHTDPSQQPVEVGNLLGDGSQGDVYEGVMEGRPVAVKWYKPEWLAADFALRKRLSAIIGRVPSSPHFLWPMAIVTSRDRSGFGHVMALRDRRFCEFSAVIAEDIHPSMRALATAAVQTAEACQQLHHSELCFVDISAHNVALDPSTGEALICDCDNVDIDGQGMPSRMAGTDGFMAPELVQRAAPPSRQTDLWSLAVLLFWAFIKNHPLEGRRESRHAVLTRDEQRKLWGAEALFIFDPRDPSNAPMPGIHDAAIHYWSMCPEFLHILFIRAFTDGIAHAEARVSEAEWRTAMARLRDAVAPCPHCAAEIFHDRQAARKCGNCGASLSPPQLICVSGHTIVAAEGAGLFAHHLDRGRLPDSSPPIATVTRNPRRPDILGLRNDSGMPWQVSLPTGEERSVATGAHVRLHPQVRIRLGTAEAVVLAADAPAPAGLAGLAGSPKPEAAPPRSAEPPQTAADFSRRMPEYWLRRVESERRLVAGGEPVVLISFASQDQKWVDDLRAFLDPRIELLHDRGGNPYAVWNFTDTHRGTKPGDEFPEIVAEKMWHCRAALILLSPGYFRSSYCKAIELPFLMWRREHHKLMCLPLKLGILPVDHVRLPSYRGDSRRVMLDDLIDDRQASPDFAASAHRNLNLKQLRERGLESEIDIRFEGVARRVVDFLKNEFGAFEA